MMTPFDVLPARNTLQLAPPSLLLNKPSPVAAYIVVGVCGSMAKASTSDIPKPKFTAFQVCPRSLLLNTPLAPAVTAYMVSGSPGITARENTILKPHRPVGGLSSSQFLPPSTLLNRPPGQ